MIVATRSVIFAGTAPPAHLRGDINGVGDDMPFVNIAAAAETSPAMAFLFRLFGDKVPLADHLHRFVSAAGDQSFFMHAPRADVIEADKEFSDVAAPFKLVVFMGGRPSFISKPVTNPKSVLDAAGEVMVSRFVDGKLHVAMSFLDPGFLRYQQLIEEGSEGGRTCPTRSLGRGDVFCAA